MYSLKNHWIKHFKMYCYWKMIMMQKVTVALFHTVLLIPLYPLIARHLVFYSLVTAVVVLKRPKMALKETYFLNFHAFFFLIVFKMKSKYSGCFYYFSKCNIWKRQSLCQLQVRKFHLVVPLGCNIHILRAASQSIRCLLFLLLKSFWVILPLYCSS